MRKIILFSILLLLLPSAVYSGAPSRPFSESAGNIVDPDRYNSNENTIYSYLQAGVDTYSTGSVDATAIGADAVGNSELNNNDAFTFSGSNTHSGTANITGTLQIDGTTVSTTAAELNILDGVTGVTYNEIDYLDGVDGTIMAEGDTAGGDLAGTYPDPTINPVIRRGSYFEPDGTCFLAYNAGVRDFSGEGLAVTPTSLNYSDLVEGKVSKVCYDYTGDDYVTTATSADQAGMSALTMEVWVYRDNTGQEDNILSNATNSYIRLYMDNTLNILGQIVTGTGTEAWSVAHGLTSGGINQWAYFVIAWDIDGVAEVYVNGVDVGDGDSTGDGTVSDSANGIIIGAAGNNGLPFHGKIDGVRLLRRKMSAAEVLARYNTFK